MRRPVILFACMCLVTPGNGAAQGTVRERTLVEAERSFARHALQHGVRDAFLSYLDDDAVVFRPGPVSGKEVYAERPASAAVLTWRPVYAEVSSAGDLGYTTGPWEIREHSPDDAPAAYGEYVSLWRRADDGPWRVVLDNGIVHPRPSKTDTTLVFHSDQSRAENRTALQEGDTSSERLLSLDRMLSKLIVERGIRQALGTVAAEDIRVLRDGVFPFVGRDSIGSDVASGNLFLEWKPAGGGIARSGDLGYTFGMVRTQDNKESSYLRIWRKGAGGEWKVALDLMRI